MKDAKPYRRTQPEGPYIHVVIFFPNRLLWTLKCHMADVGYALCVQWNAVPVRHISGLVVGRRAGLSRGDLFLNAALWALAWIDNSIDSLPGWHDAMYVMISCSHRLIFLIFCEDMSGL